MHLCILVIALRSNSINQLGPLNVFPLKWLLTVVLLALIRWRGRS